MTDLNKLGLRPEQNTIAGTNTKALRGYLHKQILQYFKEHVYTKLQNKL